jgi:hypothetical protein
MVHVVQYPAKNPNAIVYFLTSSEGKINYRVRIFLQDTVH